MGVRCNVEVEVRAVLFYELDDDSEGSELVDGAVYRGDRDSGQFVLCRRDNLVDAWMARMLFESCQHGAALGGRASALFVQLGFDVSGRKHETPPDSKSCSRVRLSRHTDLT